MQTTVFNTIGQRLRLWLGLATVLAAVAVASTPALAIAITYSLDNGVITGTFGVSGSYANEFTITSVPGQVIATVLLKQSPDLAGSCDVRVWDSTGPGGTPGAVIAGVDGAAIPQGNGWTVVDLSAQNVAVAAGAHIFVGYVRHDLPALFDDASRQTATYWKQTNGEWALWGGGYLMARLMTSVPPNPTEPTNVTLTPTNATLGDRLRATAAGSINPDPNSTMTYQYQWAKATGGGAWGDWTDGTATVDPAELVLGDRWKVRARATVPGYSSAWVESAPVTIQSLILRALPADGATNVQRQSLVQLIFRWPMVASTVESGFSLTAAGSTTPVEGTIVWKKVGVTMQFIPKTFLTPNTTYTIKVAAGVCRRGPQKVMVDTLLSFTTGGMPVPISWSPQGDSVPVSSRIVVVFDKPMDPASFTADTFKVNPAVPGRITVVDKRVTYIPDAPLAAGTTYHVWISGQVKTSTGRIMGRNFAWSFKTAAVAATTTLVATANAVATGEGAQITVNLSSAATVSVQIRNLGGQVIAALPPRALDAGLSTLLWDGRSAHGTRVPAGRYFTDVAACSPNGQQIHAQAGFEK